MYPSRSHYFRTSLDNFKRAYAEFLLLPTIIILVFLIFLIITYYLDHNQLKPYNRIYSFLKNHIFSNAQATSDLLSTIAGSVITMSSLTITLLLIVVQQTASSLSSQVFDQFLRRRINQIYFGFFIGLALYTLILLATVDPPFNPVYGATLDFIFIFIALYMLIVLIYTTINQIRPDVIINTIHDHILSAYQCQLHLIEQTRRFSTQQSNQLYPVKTSQNGFVTQINLDIFALMHDEEIILEPSLGTYVTYDDVIAFIKTSKIERVKLLEKKVIDAIHLEQQRDIASDPGYGIEQLQMIAWRSISTSQSNPSPGLQIIRCLKDILARWTQNKLPTTSKNSNNSFPIIYKDNLFERIVTAYESLAIISSESMQHPILIEIFETILFLFDRLSPDLQERTADSIERVLSTLGDFVLTAKLSNVLKDLSIMFEKNGFSETANSILKTLNDFKYSIGKLNSRTTRSMVNINEKIC